jgi:hypothetical protein
MRLKYFLGLICILLSLPANAQGIIFIWTGNELLENLNGDLLAQVKGRAYVSGVVDTLLSLQGTGNLPRAICTTLGMTDYQFADVSKKYLVNHPESRHVVAANLVYAAMVQAFSCGK